MKLYHFVLIFLVACGPKEAGMNRFSDDKLIAIYEAQDRRDNAKLIKSLKAKKEEHRIAAALAFASTKDTSAVPYLSQMLQTDQKPECRKAAAYALGQIGHFSALDGLKPAFDSELSKHNQKYILEAIGKCGDTSTLRLFENTSYHDPVLQEGWALGVFRLMLKGVYSRNLDDMMLEVMERPNTKLERDLASHYIYRRYRDSYGPLQPRLEQIIDESKDEEMSDRLRLMLEVTSGLTSAEMQARWKQFDELSTYKQAELIEAIVDSEMFGGDRRLQAGRLLQIIEDGRYDKPTMNAAYSTYFEIAGSSKWQLVLQALRTKEMALQSLACYEIHKIGKPKHVPELKLVWDDMVKELQESKKGFMLPKESETYIDVCKALEKLNGEPYKKYYPSFNHPVDWDFVKTIPEHQQVEIITSRGKIVIECFVNDAPASVTNFLKLVDEGFYDGKAFHRVVPSFVIQGGCPRGDGWGSLDWSQRSEFSNFQSYTTGTVGLASAGQDTEGVQWFITHCPTPHLDGRYTIFARVISGMDVVHQIEVGDKIEVVKRFQHKESTAS